MRRWIVTVVVAALLIGAGVGWASQRGSAAATSKYLTAKVSRGTVASAIAATGTVQPSATLSLAFGGATVGSASASGGSGGQSAGSQGARSVSSGATNVTAVNVKVGDQVAAGVTLATLDSTAAQAQLTSAQAQLTSAQQRQAAEPADTAQTTIASDAAAVAQAEQQVQSAQSTVAATALKAPVAGIITAVDISTGLPPTSPAITMRTGALQVVASVSEDDVPSLQTGQKATVRFPALSATATGTLTSLPTAADTGGGGAVTFPVTITLPQPPAHLLPGMTAQITLVIAERDHVLNVPTAALQGSTDAATVQVMSAGKPVTKSVEIGLTTNTSTEIIAGLQEGDTVVTGVVNPTTQTTTPGGLNGGGLGGTGGFRGGGFGGGGAGGFRGGARTGTAGGGTGG